MLSRGIYLEEIIKWNLWELFFTIRFCLLRIIYKWCTWRQNIATMESWASILFLRFYKLVLVYLIWVASSCSFWRPLWPPKQISCQMSPSWIKIQLYWFHGQTGQRLIVGLFPTSQHRHRSINITESAKGHLNGFNWPRRTYRIMWFRPLSVIRVFF